jgi:hypothetical protein
LSMHGPREAPGGEDFPSCVSAEQRCRRSLDAVISYNFINPAAAHDRIPCQRAQHIPSAIGHARVHCPPRLLRPISPLPTCLFGLVTCGAGATAPAPSPAPTRGGVFLLLSAAVAHRGFSDHALDGAAAAAFFQQSRSVTCLASSWTMSGVTARQLDEKIVPAAWVTVA